MCISSFLSKIAHGFNFKSIVCDRAFWFQLNAARCQLRSRRQKEKTKWNVYTQKRDTFFCFVRNLKVEAANYDDRRRGDRRDIGHRREALQCINRCLYYTKIVCLYAFVPTIPLIPSDGLVLNTFRLREKEKTKQKESTHLIVCGVTTRRVIMRWLNVIETMWIDVILFQCDWNKKKKIVFYLRVFWRFIRRGRLIWFFPKKKKILLYIALELPVPRVHNFTYSRERFDIYLKFIILL